MKINIAEELKIVGTEPQLGTNEGRPRYNTPITPRENFQRYFERENALWYPGNADTVDIMPKIIPDNIARATVVDTETIDVETEAGGRDMFGIEWTYDHAAGGSMVKPGTPAVPDICEWEKYITLPDLDSWDWEGASERLRPYYSTCRANKTMIYTGLFERLISFLDFEGAAMALVDEDSQPAVHRLFDTLCNIYDELIGRLKKHFMIDMITFHDDWGSQRAPFFSLSTCREMLAPYLKRVVESAHKRGIIFDFHCCGKNEQLVPAMLKAGVDMWSGQNLNDWELLSGQTKGKIFYSIVWKKYDPAEFKSEQEFLDATFEMWEHYNKFEGVWLNAARYGNELARSFWERTYAASREQFAAK